LRNRNLGAENGVRNASSDGAACSESGGPVVEESEFDEDEQLLVAHVRPRRGRAAAVWPLSERFAQRRSPLVRQG
jgi:hypothetical protein